MNDHSKHAGQTSTPRKYQGQVEQASETPPPHKGDGKHEGGSHAAGAHDHGAMIADFRRRFWICVALTVPVLALAPMIQSLLGLRDTLRFPGDGYVQALLASVIYFYGGWPFLKGFFGEMAGSPTKPIEDTG